MQVMELESFLKSLAEPIRNAAASFPAVDTGTSCNQRAFKAGKKAFLYIGEQGGRYKAMFKLKQSLAEAKRLARSDPDDYQVGSTSWVTARFSAQKPMPKRLWAKWLDESYALSRPTGATDKRGKKAAGKKREGAR